MAIVVTCSNGHKLRMKDGSAGKKVRCPKCQDVVRVPASAKPRPRRHQTPPVEVSPVLPDGAGGEEEWAPRIPRRRSTKSTKARPSSGSSSKLPIFIGGGVALVAVIAVVFFLMQNRKPDLQKSDPQNTAEAPPQGDNANAVKKIVVAFLDAKKKKDDDRVKAVLTAKARKQYQGAERGLLVSEESYTLGKATIENNTAVVRIIFVTDHGATSGYVRLRREGDQWRVYGKGTGKPKEEGLPENDSPSQKLEYAMSFENYEKSRHHVPFPDEFSANVGLNGSGSSKQFTKNKPKHPMTTVEKGGYTKKITLSYKTPMGIFSPSDNLEPPMYGILELAGKSLFNATAYGFLKVDSAQDDAGNKLKLRPTPRLGNEKSTFVKLPNFLMFSGAPGSFNSKKTVRIPLILDSPTSSAKQLDRLEGSVQIVAGGERKKIVVAKVIEKLGTDVSDPALKKAGLTITIDRPNPKQSKTQQKKLALTVKGPAINLINFKLLGSGDKSLISFTSWSGSGDTQKIQLGTEKELPADARLVLEVAFDQHPVSIPFKFENVKLPVNPVGEPAELLTSGVQQKLTLSYERPFGAGANVPFGTKALFALLELTSNPIANSSAYGVFQVKTAQDNKGKSLKLIAPVKSQFGKALARQYVDRFMFTRDKKDTLKFHLLLDLPSPKATHLTRLEGSMRVKGRESVVIDDILQKTGKALTNPKLKSVGRLIVRMPTKRDRINPDHGLVVEFSGKAANIHGLTLLDGEGHQMSAFTMGFSIGSKKTSTIDAGKKLPPDTKLKITLGGDEKVTEIPFKFENFPLPGGNVKKNNSSR